MHNTSLLSVIYAAKVQSPLYSLPDYMQYCLLWQEVEFAAIVAQFPTAAFGRHHGKKGWSTGKEMQTGFVMDISAVLRGSNENDFIWQRKHTCSLHSNLLFTEYTHVLDVLTYSTSIFLKKRLEVFMRHFFPEFSSLGLDFET